MKQRWDNILVQEIKQIPLTRRAKFRNSQFVRLGVRQYPAPLESEHFKLKVAFAWAGCRRCVHKLESADEALRISRSTLIVDIGILKTKGHTMTNNVMTSGFWIFALKRDP